MMPQAKKFLIIDGNALVHRAYHALPPLKTKQGELVNAVYGFLLVLFRAIKDLKPGFIAACFDLAAPTFRHKQFKEYKAKRVKAPDELYQQLGRVKEVLAAFNIPIFEKEGFEADDVIGTLSTHAQEKQAPSETGSAQPAVESIILSGDLDNLQLVNKQTRVYTMRKGIKDMILYDEAAVKERYEGLRPDQLQDYRGLRGDPSDNIPGVIGIGEKTAIVLLNSFGSLENIYHAIEKENPEASQIKPATQQKLKSYKEQAFLSKQLARIDCDVPVDFNLEICRFNYDIGRARRILEEMEFFSLIEKMPLSGNHEPAAKTPDSLFNNESVPKGDGVLAEIENMKEQGILSEEIAAMEKSLVPIIEKMEGWGVKIDLKKINFLSRELGKGIASLQKEIYQSADVEFNINSPQQLSGVIFGKLGISPQGLRKTPGGVVSTRESELAKISASHPIIAKVLRYRELFKLKSGFVDSLPQMISPKDGRIHPHFHQLGTETGRLSCSNPNLQNIPVKGKLGQSIRGCFVAEEGFEFLSADYSQFELRIAASVAKDEKMLKLFKRGEDIHVLIASEIFNIPKEKVDKSSRDIAKTLNFGVLYGMGAVSFAERTGVARQKAKEFIEEYFHDFAGIARYVQEAKEKAEQNGFTETLFGRKRFLPEIHSRDPRLRAQAERIAVNMPIQGTCADIVKMAMVRLQQQGVIGVNCRLLLQIHDELLFEVKSDKIKTTALKVKRTMEEIVELEASLKVETRKGPSWGDLSLIF